MARNHPYHTVSQRYSCSNCCISINVILFFITLISGISITAAILVPSIQYKENWLALECSLISKQIEPITCQSEKECKEDSNQVRFPYYFYDNGRNDFIVNTINKEIEQRDSSSSTTFSIRRNAVYPTTSAEISNECPSTKPYPCYRGIISFNYPLNKTFNAYQSLYIQGDYMVSSQYVQSVETSLFPCWINSQNNSQVSIQPIPLYSPGGAIAVGVLFSLSLLTLILILIFISIRCFCKNDQYNQYQYIL
ncbi:hypothetical protein DLAC_01864 [Tieghemostelium lacteum]|uniref:Uncharacterized protein n=1 Tax=Tieghemostelium lacteum TaxID=361077 RepID=A0A152A724_TIELA|nr:hypothetical protein DLAC_01864 [Tieghemostelium lacteum]|eukprot:KYR01847.1 hypothetical protein DLAC_01864 [Tieghemostelium lacteum]